MAGGKDCRRKINVLLRTTGTGRPKTLRELAHRPRGKGKKKNRNGTQTHASALWTAKSGKLNESQLAPEGGKFVNKGRQGKGKDEKQGAEV